MFLRNVTLKSLTFPHAQNEKKRRRIESGTDTTNPIILLNGTNTSDSTSDKMVSQVNKVSDSLKDCHIIQGV